MKTIAFVAALLCGTAAAAQTVTSPDGRNSATLAIDAENRASYTVRRDGQVVIEPSSIVLELERDRLGYGMAITGTDTRSADERYPVVAGKTAAGRDRYNETTFHLAETGGARRAMDVVVRAYDGGIAFRTVLPVQGATAGTVVRDEQSFFNFAPTARCWGFNPGKFGSSHEGEYDPVDVTAIREHNLFDLPFLCETGTAAFALAESDILGFSGMYLVGRPDGGTGLRTRLSPSLDDPRVAVRTRIGSPVRTPWRVVMLADKAGQLVENTLVRDLATPSRIADTGWIRPGKASWDWWNGPSVASVTKPGTTTESAKAFIDFAAAQGLRYAMIDEGWYVGTPSAPLVLPGTDVTRSVPGFDLPAVMAYAKAKQVDVWLWVHWKALDAQMEEALDFYRRMGVAGIKVDFMDRDDQAMVDWYARLLESAARHRIMVNLHGAFVPRGLNRTYPHFVTQEGVLGAEYNKWSRRITARHNVMLAYTRNLLGPADYTPGGFRNIAPAELAKITPRGQLPYVQTTRAHGLALYVVYDSPVAMVSDSPDTYAASPDGLDFVAAVPTTWDETRFVAGTVGDYIAVARRKGRDWYVGTLNNETGRTVRLPLTFLGAGRYAAKTIGDGATPTALVRTTRNVGAGDTLDLTLAGSGGAVAVLTAR